MRVERVDSAQLVPPGEDELAGLPEGDGVGFAARVEQVAAADAEAGFEG
jgi:hypothetical protein